MLAGLTVALSYTNAHRSVRIDQHAVGVVDLADNGKRLRVVDPVTGELVGQAPMLRLGQRGPAMVSKSGYQLGGGRSVAVKQFIQQTLEV